MTLIADTLPPLRGTLTPNRDMAGLSWLRTGGPAEVLAQPADREDLAAFLAALDPAIPLLPVGVCSNLIIRDGGLLGVTLRLGRGFNGIEILPGHRVRAGAAALDAHVARKAGEAGIAGLEFLRTIPGAIGGAVKMNAGCYGTYTADVVEEVTIVTRDGTPRRLSAAEIGFGYRSSAVPEGAVVVEAVLAGRPGDPAEIAAAMEEALARRAASQPVTERSCGSTFRNPAGFSSTGRADDVHDLKAWKLIEDAGCRGLRRGGAQMSPMHANFLVNTGGATSADLEDLGEDVRKRVLNISGITLDWEIMRVGLRAPQDPLATAP
ncbi:UDP-N-acetylmuramate dehydrogenase [Paroceanicella profunda]|uniref:UDP-N-acetylenolpyruvoylglucosamine reductase n=1 Tax=Paroceanicella profunda TaxID=2579971 RepID=A0A5B8FVX1_9RHOB|nr:UDP-N-acetylmuramate dehydrogenase [Paroceanicella profunda]QDL90502.1 UDP-N-acetylmuramate dehydrogenase [Paroceanicella profunda]